MHIQMKQGVVGATFRRYGLLYFVKCNNLIFLHLKTRHCKYYTSNIMYIKIYKIIMDEKLTKSTKISPQNEQSYPTLQTGTTQ